MERLTNHFDYCDFVECRHRNAELAKENKCNFLDMTGKDNCHDKRIYEKLREYEDLEEQGLLLKLPCKVGDTFWELNTTHEVPIIYPRKAHTLQHCNYVADGLGVRAFLSQEEAEAALARLEKQGWLHWNYQNSKLVA